MFLLDILPDYNFTEVNILRGGLPGQRVCFQREFTAYYFIETPLFYLPLRGLSLNCCAILYKKLERHTLCVL